MSLASGNDGDPLGLTPLMKHAQERSDQAKATMHVTGKLARFMFAAVYLFVSAAASLATPLTRHRLGILTCLVHGGLGGLLLVVLLLRTPPGPGRWLVALWLLVFAARLLMELVLAVMALLKPRLPHRHRWSGGEFLPPLAWLWARLHSWTKLRLPESGFVAELGILLALTIGLFWVEAWLNTASENGSTLSSGVVPLLAIQGLLGQGLVMTFRSAWQIQVLLDTQHEQQDLSERIAGMSEAGRDREVEAVASIPKPRRRTHGGSHG